MSLQAVAHRLRRDAPSPRRPPRAASGRARGAPRAPTECVQPEPCAAPSGIARARDRHDALAVAEVVDRVGAGGVPAGHDRRTCGPSATMRARQRGRVARRRRGRPPRSSARASSRFGVTTVARGSSSDERAGARPARAAAPRSRTTITGSSTTGRVRDQVERRAHRRDRLARSPACRSSPRPRRCRRPPPAPGPTIASGGTGVTPSTATVFCHVSAVIAVMPWTPQRANAFRSAWIPAPPPESEPAIDSTRGMRVGAASIAVKHRHRPGRCQRSGCRRRRGRAARGRAARAR